MVMGQDKSKRRTQRPRTLLKTKTGFFLSGGGCQWEGGRHKERVNKGECGRCIFVFIYENRKMKSVEIVLRRGRKMSDEGSKSS
jgi:hypothetical protein